jgi:hypothetical protein
MLNILISNRKLQMEEVVGHDARAHHVASIHDDLDVDDLYTKYKVRMESIVINLIDI